MERIKGPCVLDEIDLTGFDGSKARIFGDMDFWDAMQEQFGALNGELVEVELP